MEYKLSLYHSKSKSDFCVLYFFLFLDTLYWIGSPWLDPTNCSSPYACCSCLSCHCPGFVHLSCFGLEFRFISDLCLRIHSWNIPLIGYFHVPDPILFKFRQRISFLRSSTHVWRTDRRTDGLTRPLIEIRFYSINFSGSAASMILTKRWHIRGHLRERFFSNV